MWNSVGKSGIVFVLLPTTFISEFLIKKHFITELGHNFACIFRPFGTLTLLSTLMSEVVKNLMTNNSEEETWSWEARDILLDTWTALLMVFVSNTLKYALNTMLRFSFYTTTVSLD